MFVEKENYFAIEEFEKYGITAVFTKKNAGNIAHEVLDSENAVRNRQKLLAVFEKSEENLFYSKQVHEDKIYVVEEGESGKSLEGYDAFITKNKEAVILTKYADCLPVYFYDMGTGAFGMAHSGWKGSYLGIAVKTASKMEKEFGTKREELLIGLGVGMKGCCYEVGNDLYDKFSKKFTKETVSSSFSKRDNKIYFDNEEFNAVILEKYGIKKENIIKSGMCTGCGGKHFSFRIEKEMSGRNGGLIFYGNSKK